MTEKSENNLQDFERRLLLLENKVEALVRQSGAATSSISPSNVAVKPKAPEQSPNPSNQIPTQTAGDSARFLGVVGVICFVLAASYFIKLAIDQGWLTPLRQLIGAWLFGFSLVAVGFRLREKDTQYASLLPAAGIVVLFMATYAGHLYFQLYDVMLAVVIVNCLSIACVLIYRSFRENIYALAATVGTYLVPILIQTDQSSLRAISIYYLFWGVVYSAIAISLRSRIFIGVAAYMAIFTLASYCFEKNISKSSPDLLFLIIFQALQFILYSAAVALYSIKHRAPLKSTEAWAFFPVLLLFYLTEYGLLHTLNETNAPWYALGFAVLVFGVYLAATRILGSKGLESFPMVSAFLSLVTVHAFYLNILPESLSPWFGVLLLLGYALVKRAGGSFQYHTMSLLVLGWIVVVEYGRAVVEHSPTLQTVLLNLLFAVLLYVASGEEKKPTSKYSGILVKLSAVQFLLGLKHLAEILLITANARYATSALWCLSALLLLVISKQNRDKELASSSLWLFGIVAVKVLLFDLSASGPSAQIIALLVIGIFFYAGGYVYRQINTN